MTAPRIVLLLNLQIGYCRRAVRGIAAYGPGHTWVIESLPANRSSLELIARWEPMGVIAHVLDAEFGRELERLGIPVVSISSCVPGLSLPVVDSDHHEVGRLAAEHLWGMGARRFAFFGSASAAFSLDRERGFRAFLLERGQEVDAHYCDYTLRPPFHSDLGQLHRETEEWLRQLKKPVAVFCPDDEHARQLGTLCRELNLSVPNQVALLGVDNDETMCFLSWPPLSSVDNPAEEIGYHAAKILDSMLENPGARPDDQFIRPIQVIARASTDRFSVEDPTVGRALNFIREKIGERSLCVDDVAEGAGVSRRALERRFASVLGMGVVGAIRRARVERAKLLLRQSSRPIEHISLECGFANYRRMGVVFKSLTDLSPSAFRRFYETDQYSDGLR